MFTWICPKCGREVGPSYSECPFCAELTAKAAPPPAPAPLPPYVYAPPQQQYAPPPTQALYNYPPPQQVAAPAPPAPPAPVPVSMPEPPPPPPQQIYYVGADDNKPAIHGWAAALLAFAVIGGLVFALVWYTRQSRTGGAAAAKKTERAGDHPFKKSLELTGFRVSEASGKKLQVQFLAINHGTVDMSDISGVVVLKARGAETDAPACTFKFRISGIPAFGAKEIIVTDFTQKRKFFEMPDWQFLEPVVEITSAP